MSEFLNGVKILRVNGVPGGAGNHMLCLGFGSIDVKKLALDRDLLKEYDVLYEERYKQVCISSKTTLNDLHVLADNRAIAYKKKLLTYPMQIGLRMTREELDQWLTALLPIVARYSGPRKKARKHVYKAVAPPSKQLA